MRISLTRVHTLLLLFAAVAAPAAAQARGDAASLTTGASSAGAPRSMVLLRANEEAPVWRPALPDDPQGVVLSARPTGSKAPHRAAVAGAVVGGAEGLYFSLVLMEDSDAPAIRTAPLAVLFTAAGAIGGGVLGYGLGKLYGVTHRSRYVDDPARRHPYGMDEQRHAPSIPSADGIPPRDSAPPRLAVPAGV